MFKLTKRNIVQIFVTFFQKTKRQIQISNHSELLKMNIQNNLILMNSFKKEAETEYKANL